MVEEEQSGWYGQAAVRELEHVLERRPQPFEHEHAIEELIDELVALPQKLGCVLV